MLKQELQQKLIQRLSPQQIQLMKLLQLPTVALEQRIKEEMETNPALDEGAEEQEEDFDTMDDYVEEDQEENEAQDEFDFSEYMDDDIPSYKLSASNRSADDEVREMPLSVGGTFHELLEAQLGLRVLGENQEVIGKHLVGNLDDSGYLRRELDAIVDDLAFSQNVTATVAELEELLKIIQGFDPPGVGARNLQECLLLQLDRKEKNEAREMAKIILEDHFEAFTKKHYNKIIKKEDIKEATLKNGIDEILKLNPKPGNSLNETQRVIEHIVPDFTITTQNDKLELTINSRNAPELKISRKYSEMLETYVEAKDKPGKAQKEAIMFVKQKLDSAKWFIDAINQRHETLSTTMEAIMEHQEEYFLTGDETKLNPMILKNIAEKVGLDLSTISRVANSKYVQTAYGTFLLKTFFSESLSTETGEEVSTREVKKILQDIVDAEDKRKPVTDNKLTKELKAKGYNIARRTIAKYREQLNIPVARLRKEL